MTMMKNNYAKTNGVDVERALSHSTGLIEGMKIWRGTCDVPEDEKKKKNENKQKTSQPMREPCDVSPMGVRVRTKNCFLTSSSNSASLILGFLSLPRGSPKRVTTKTSKKQAKDKST